MTFDFVHMRSLNESTLKKMSNKFGVVGSRKYFLLVGLSFKPLIDDEDIEIRAICHKYGSKEMTLYVENEVGRGILVKLKLNLARSLACTIEYSKNKSEISNFSFTGNPSTAADWKNPSPPPSAHAAAGHHLHYPPPPLRSGGA
ncbi:RNA-binding (RRM/RBD/RNP motifs) family protein [Striga asiatica]|uniref:RNA-binding (RRM/RBD/RNP motifs) family protein n=1 Tax=Striga asiatica TaxID=4170 RepID=A0A5A7PPK6_STRAF|nr:RNA-binding (RRM/RBD/RNP motifs) family protein [Striga asiatica]